MDDPELDALILEAGPDGEVINPRGRRWLARMVGVVRKSQNARCAALALSCTAHGGEPATCRLVADKITALNDGEPP